MTDKTSYIETDKPLYISNLTARMECNETFGGADFEKWVFSHLDFNAGCRLIDVGCGTGKASLKLLDLHPQIGDVLAIDFAETAIETLKIQSQELGINQIQALVMDMERLAGDLSDQQFDHIFSIYAIHYSPRMADLLCEYKALLKPGGSIFFCGPDAFCNTNVMRMLVSAEDCMDRNPIPQRMLKPFISQSDLELLSRFFTRVEVDYFENAINFPDVESFLVWWRNHDLYRPDLEELVRQRVAQQIRCGGTFMVNKNVIGVTLSQD